MKLPEFIKRAVAGAVIAQRDDGDPTVTTTLRTQLRSYPREIKDDGKMITKAKIDAVSDEDIKFAVDMAVGELFSQLQSKIGQDAGDVASHFMSGREDEIHDFLGSFAKGYLSLERLYAKNDAVSDEDDQTELWDTLRTRAASGPSRYTTAVWKLTAFLVGVLGGGRTAPPASTVPAPDGYAVECAERADGAP